VIAGGAGFIGKAVATRYLSEGHRVIIIDCNREEAIRFKEGEDGYVLVTFEKTKA